MTFLAIVLFVAAWMVSDALNDVASALDKGAEAMERIAESHERTENESEP